MTKPSSAPPSLANALLSSAQWRKVLEEPHLPGQSSHLVMLYLSEAFFIDTLSLFVSAGLQAGEAVVVIATPDHLQSLQERLQPRFELQALMQNRQLMLLEAAETLAKFRADGQLLRAKFMELMGGLLREVNARFGTVRAYGEMVGILHDTGDASGRGELEGLWNELAQTQAFSLLCGYRMDAFAGPGGGEAVAEIFDSHTAVVTDERHVHGASIREQLRSVLGLQRRLIILSEELARRVEVEGQWQRMNPASDGSVLDELQRACRELREPAEQLDRSLQEAMGSLDEKDGDLDWDRLRRLNVVAESVASLSQRIEARFPL